MRKEEFLKQLDYLLQDIPAEDREEAMAYYHDYLMEAGPENEEAATRSFGSPERAAALIRADLAGNLKDKDNGFFTETGYEDERYRDPNYQVAKRLDLPEERTGEQKQNQSYAHHTDYGRPGDSHGYRQYHGPYEEGPYRETYTSNQASQPSYHNEPKKPWTNSLLKWILVAILLIVASPLIIGAGSVFGVAVMIAVGVVLLLAICSIGLFLFSVAAMVVAIIMAFTIPVEGILILGGALVGFGCSILGLLCLYGIIFVMCPWMFRVLKKLATALIGRRKEANV